ncbi:hypothetical protein RchiOBHm_Chr1g0352761 [Rosa chinensis]|uniref:Uncharacterized protein n=1 Tax=Rosa chinensis TaxID=74649 RepID=A0A2P6SGM4_ROSCH|nr:hypothetical protein RchiOBHm_Chr1g0352761 [Rosa chinensis]
MQIRSARMVKETSPSHAVVVVVIVIDSGGGVRVIRMQSKVQRQKARRPNSRFIELSGLDGCYCGRLMIRQSCICSIVSGSVGIV